MLQNVTNCNISFLFVMKMLYLLLRNGHRKREGTEKRKGTVRQSLSDVRYK